MIAGTIVSLLYFTVKPLHPPAQDECDVLRSVSAQFAFNVSAARSSLVSFFIFADCFIAVSLFGF
jgi:hypothetical protein